MASPDYHDPLAWEPRPAGRFGASALLFLIVGFLALMLVWASMAELDEVTRAPGRVVPSSQVQVIQNLEGGIVREILVRQGDTVREGQVLLRMDPTRFDAEFRRGQEEYLALQARTARLQAESNGLPLDFPAAVVRGVPEIVTAETALYETRRSGLKARLRVLRSQLDQRSKALAEAKAALENAGQSLQLAESELEILEPLVRRGLESRVELIRAGQRVAAAKGNRDAAALAIERHRAAIMETENELALAAQDYRTGTMEELAAATRELNGLLESMPALEDRVSRTEVRSPVDGVVNQVHLTTAGGVAEPGETLVEVVPLGDTLLIEAEIRPADIAFLAPGQPGRVKITAYDYAVFGVLEAELEHLGADAITNKSGESVYRAQVRTRQAYLEANGQRLPIMPGMVAEVDILTGKKTVMDYMLSPLADISAKALRER